MSSFFTIFTDMVLLKLCQCSISAAPENVRKPVFLLTFSGGIEIKHWREMGLEYKEIFL